VDADRIAAIGYCFGGTTCLELARAGAPLKGVVSFHGNLSNPNPQDDASIKARVLVATGGADEMVPPEDCVAFCKSMEENKVDYTFVVYGGAEHAFTNPAADKAGIRSVKYQKAADERSWGHMKQFLAVCLGPAAGAEKTRTGPTGD
jgi:dienelactone hydrolase